MAKNSLLPTSDQFRTDFPEFSDATRYPDASVNFYLNQADCLLNQMCSAASSFTSPSCSRPTIQSFVVRLLQAQQLAASTPPAAASSHPNPWTRYPPAMTYLA